MTMTTTTKNTKKVQVKVLGQTVTVGTKQWRILTERVKQFNDLASHETN
jgi:hypothetical protein